MNEKKFAEQFGNIDSAFVDEALDYRPLKSRGGIYMSKKTLISIALAAVLIIAAMGLITAAESPILFARGENGEIVENGHYYESQYEFDHYFGSLKDGTAVMAEEGSVEITAVKAEDGAIKFVINADTSVAPFDEYGDLYIMSYGLYDLVKERLQSCTASSPFDTVYGWGHGTYDGNDIKFDDYYDDDYTLVFVEKPKNGVYSDFLQYKLIVYGIAGRNADGKILEIRGEWEVEFTF